MLKGNDHEIKFHEIEIAIFHEIEIFAKLIMRLKLAFFRRSKRPYIQPEIVTP
jgi:hypothetical protein